MVSVGSRADSALRSSLEVEAKQNFGLRGLSYEEIQRGSNSRVILSHPKTGSGFLSETDVP